MTDKIYANRIRLVKLTTSLDSIELVEEKPVQHSLEDFDLFRDPNPMWTDLDVYEREMYGGQRRRQVRD